MAIGSRPSALRDFVGPACRPDGGRRIAAARSYVKLELIPMTDRAAMLQEILAQSPDDAFARYGLALEYANAGQTEDALREFQTILDKNPDYVPAYQMSAQTLITAGRPDEARTFLEKGIATAQRTRNQHALSEMEGMLMDLG